MGTYIHELKGRLVSQKQDILSEAAKAVPAWAVVLWNKLSDAPLEKWATAAALLYTLLQIYFLVRDRRRGRRVKK